ncbi:hypothetical protein K431DRAFT_301695 [Polychaeton citri CBS 116435]|uniref:Uncharacterized protein n=1 Tax=Polychaeton citri CBS 116435 TaxID=1314669 RepID=A0A9P4QEX3_9PEZI|nr:hypothetical protein K431DRAFT_301695 [Polychaeton citri CBS 116435]
MKDEVKGDSEVEIVDGLGKSVDESANEEGTESEVNDDNTVGSDDGEYDEITLDNDGAAGIALITKDGKANNDDVETLLELCEIPVEVGLTVNKVDDKAASLKELSVLELIAVDTNIGLRVLPAVMEFNNEVADVEMRVEEEGEGMVLVAEKPGPEPLKNFRLIAAT